MNKTILAPSFILLMCGIFSTVQGAEVARPQHLQRIEELQRRADKLAFGDIGSNNYHLAKARTWLNFALSEHFAMDYSGVVSAATEQAETLLDALESNQTDISQDTPRQVAGGDSVRQDQWDKIAALKNHAQFSCGQRHVAEAEVHLVWAGHEKTEYGWSHAESYARTAEYLVYEATAAINDCAEASLQETPARVVEKITQSGDALFEFRKATLNSYSLWRLDKLVDSIRGLTTLDGVDLVGHTDHLSKDGRQKFNILLSRKRAESIKQYLIGKGVPAEKISARGVGSLQPLIRCSTKQSKVKHIACLQPNRRVDITLRGEK